MEKANPRIMLTEPLSPGILEANGMLPPGWASQERDAPEAGRWTDYWVTTNHGWNEAIDAGMLRIATKPNENGGRHVKIEYHVALLGGFEHRIHADIHCDDTELNPMRRWTMRSMTTGPNGENRPDLNGETSARLEDGRWVETIHGKHFGRDWPTTLCGDWALMDAATRMQDVAKPTEQSFAALDNLTTLKVDQHWQALPEAYRSDEANGVALRGFYQSGIGVLPREFWINEAGKLAMVIDYNRVFVSDTHARQRYDAMLNERRPEPMMENA